MTPGSWEVRAATDLEDIKRFLIILVEVIDNLVRRVENLEEEK